HVYTLPQDVIDNTILAFNTSPTSPTGYAGAAPSGQYFAPANGPDCIEVDSAARYGDCAARSVVVTGPMFRQTDIRLSKRTKLAGRVDFELGAHILNVFNQPDFLPIGQVGTATSIASSSATHVLSNYENTRLPGP